MFAERVFSSAYVGRQNSIKVNYFDNEYDKPEWLDPRDSINYHPEVRGCRVQSRITIHSWVLSSCQAAELGLTTLRLLTVEGRLKL